MSTVTTPLGVGSTQVYDYAYVTGLDMEAYQTRYVGGVYTKGSDGYIVLNVTGLSWSSSASSLDPVTDSVFVDLDVSGYDPEFMSQIKDASGVPLKNYRITTPNGSIAFNSTNSNVAKYVWAVRNGVVQDAVLNDDNTFTAARLVASVQNNNAIAAANKVSFTLTYTLSFVDLGSTVAGVTPATAANLAVDQSKPSHVKVLSAPAFASTDSGYVLLKLGTIASTSVNPVRTSDFAPRLNDDPPAFYATLHDGTVLHSQYAARHARTKDLSGTTPRFALFVVNQGKIGRNAEVVDTVYNLAKLQLLRGQSDDNATVALNYNVSSATV